MQETRPQSLGGEEPLKKETATHARILTWEVPRTEKPGGLQSTGLQTVRLDTKEQQGERQVARQGAGAKRYPQATRVQH